MSGEFRDASRGETLRQFSPTRILFPIVLGGGIVAYLLYRELLAKGLTPGELFARLEWTPRTFEWLALGCVMLVLRDFGYVWQLRILTDRKVSWKGSLQIILLWNFFAAVSPAMVGGAAMAVFMLGKEGLGYGRATAIVFTTVFFDQVFYASIPIMVSLLIPQDDLFAPLDAIPSDLLGSGMQGAFWSAWGGIAVYVLFLVAALFVAPSWINGGLTRLFSAPPMHRWRAGGLLLADELMEASRDLRARSMRWWLTAWAATSVAWIGRYLLLNCVLAAFSVVPMSMYDHALASGRQAVLWILMTISPTPGGTGVAELGFSWLFKDLVHPGLALTLAIIWRLIAYYPYLILGVPVMTRWIKRVYGRDVREG
jgi:uncharacterized membrane protein YbhN (UPF0104 family)